MGSKENSLVAMTLAQETDGLDQADIREVERSGWIEKYIFGRKG